jgi:PAS domain S-box-containing protein
MQRSALIRITSGWSPESGNLTGSLRGLTEEAARTLGVARAGIWRYSPDRLAIECVDLYETATGEHHTGSAVRASACPEYFMALAEADVIATESAVDDPRTSGLADAYLRPLGIGAMLDVPIHVGGRLAGVLCHEHVGGPRRWTADEKTFAVSMANLVSLALESAERRQAEAELRASEERFRELAETVQDVFWISNAAKSHVLYVSPAYEAIWGRSCQSLYALPRSWQDAIHEDDRERIARAAATRQVDGSYDEEYRIVRPDGQVRWIRDRAFPVRNADGQIERLVGVARDITTQVRTEEQLRHSQKMEAIGRLAGGVAHDFNNVLSAIMIQADLTVESRRLADEDREAIQQIRAATERAASLTRQLLMFSRRQVMQTRDLDLNVVVSDIAKMLQRIIGEDVRLEVRLNEASLPTRADAGMLDQVLMNLSVNARDAMPGGGRLLIETLDCVVDGDGTHRHPDARPGRYVCLRVSDTGTGMAPDVLPRIFEPFFTTKAPGRGTGLGLATVFGIVRQHEGWIDVHSEVGRGTRFEVCLPAVESAAEPVSRPVAASASGGTEAILLVEDEEPVRMLARRVLERRGYRVIEAGNGADALRLWQEHRREIRLLLTDLVMPEGVSGHQLASQLVADEPRLKVVFTSGYSADMGEHARGLPEGHHFVQKPFSPHQLLTTIRQSLDG